MAEPLLEVDDLSVEYVTDAGDVRAVIRVSFAVGPGEFLGIVGESGCGKSTLLFGVAQLLSPPGRGGRAERSTVPRAGHGAAQPSTSYDTCAGATTRS